MNCPKCGKSTIVIDKRWMPVMYQKSGYNKRRRECKECLFRFETEEIYRYPIDRKKERRNADKNQF